MFSAAVMNTLQGSICASCARLVCTNGSLWGRVKGERTVNKLPSFGILFVCDYFRCTVLVDSVTETVFDYVRRGLFERDKLTVATMLTLKILVNDGLLAQEEVDYLVMSKVRVPGLGVQNTFRV